MVEANAEEQLKTEEEKKTKAIEATLNEHKQLFKKLAKM